MERAIFLKPPVLRGPQEGCSSRVLAALQRRDAPEGLPFQAGPHRFRAQAPVAQLDRAPDYESGGREFESSPARHLNSRKQTIISRMLGRVKARSRCRVITRSSMCAGAVGLSWMTLGGETQPAHAVSSRTRLESGQDDRDVFCGSRRRTNKRPRQPDIESNIPANPPAASVGSIPSLSRNMASMAIAESAAARQSMHASRWTRAREGPAQRRANPRSPSAGRRRGSRTRGRGSGSRPPPPR